MNTKFIPNYTITSSIHDSLQRIEKAKEIIEKLRLDPDMATSLSESVRLQSTHYSTMIEGNRLTADQVKQVIRESQRFSGLSRDENEVKGYYAARKQIEQWAAKQQPITEISIKKIHGMVVGNGRVRVKPTPYRDGQNVIIEGLTRRVIYLPPEARDVQPLVHSLLEWITHKNNLSIPVIAAIAHYQLVTIHPYYDGNGRTARLLTTLLLHHGGYDLKGLYILESYYAKDLTAYYNALTVGPSHNYYLGRAEADITNWINYFLKGMAIACEQSLDQLST